MYYVGPVLGREYRQLPCTSARVVYRCCHTLFFNLPTSRRTEPVLEYCTVIELIVRHDLLGEEGPHPFHELLVIAIVVALFRSRQLVYRVSEKLGQLWRHVWSLLAKPVAVKSARPSRTREKTDNRKVSLDRQLGTYYIATNFIVVGQLLVV